MGLDEAATPLQPRCNPGEPGARYVAHFTDAWVRDVAVTTRTDFRDDVTTGLLLRVSPTGAKTWALWYRHRGRARRVKLASYPGVKLGKARRLAEDAFTALGAGTDPAAIRQDARTPLAFTDFCDRYIAQYAKPKKRTWRDDRWLLDTAPCKRWKARAADEVTRADVRELLADVAATRGRRLAGKLHAVLSKLYAWGLAQGYAGLETHPVKGLPNPGKAGTRERTLSASEIGTLWTTLATAETLPADDPAALAPAVALWLRLRLLTAQRAHQVAAMRWADLDFDRHVWAVPASGMKKNRPHVVPLTPWVEHLLTTWRATIPASAPFVLYGARNRAKRSGVGARLGVEEAAPNDLRRTAATGMAALGVTRFIVARVLGHVDNTVTGLHYDMFEYLEEKSAALLKWERHVAEIVGERRFAEPAKVVTLAGRRGRR